MSPTYCMSTCHGTRSSCSTYLLEVFSPALEEGVFQWEQLGVGHCCQRVGRWFGEKRELGSAVCPGGCASG